MDFDDNIFDIGEDLEDDNDIEEELEEISSELKLEKAHKNITLPVMTKYEKSVIISQRIRQLEANYKTNIPETVREKGLVKSFDIAMEEFKQGKLPPFIIKRQIGNNRYEEWRFEDFKYFPPI